MTETRAEYNTGDERQSKLEVIRQDDMAIIVKVGEVTICKDYSIEQDKLTPAVVHLWVGNEILLRYITVARAEQLAANITQAVAIARRLDSLVKERADFERVNLTDLEV